jgi:preprotein translocase subunit SecE
MAIGVKMLEDKKIEKSVQTVKPTTTTKVNTSYLSEIKTEFSKITWTTKDELIFYTKLVVGATFVSGIAVYIVDLSIRSVLNSLETIVKFIFG